MLSLELCQPTGTNRCQHLKIKVNDDLSRVHVCEKTGREPRCMKICPEIEAML